MKLIMFIIVCMVCIGVVCADGVSINITNQPRFEDSPHTILINGRMVPIVDTNVTDISIAEPNPIIDIVDNTISSVSDVSNAIIDFFGSILNNQPEQQEILQLDNQSLQVDDQLVNQTMDINQTENQTMDINQTENQTF